jgi:signal transduction histidine kinase
MSRERANVALAKGPTVAVAQGSGSPPAAKPRLLLVDDERQVLDGLSLHLRRQYDVVACTSGAEALAMLDRDAAFAAVISDLRMPGMDGVELLTEIRRRAPDTTRVLLTGYADVSSAMAAVNDAAVHRFLTKPCAPAQLARALEEAVISSRGGSFGVLDAEITALGRQATLGTMAGSIGQEIGNVVAALAGSIEMLQAQVSRGEVPASEDMGILSLLKNRMHEHTRTLQELSKPRPSKVEPLDVGTMVCAAVELLKKTGILKVAKTEIRLPFSPLLIEADRALFEGVLINLLKNAAEAVAERVAAAEGWVELGEPPLITVDVAPHGEDAVAIVIEDNGVGLSPENLGRLFKKYFTTKSKAGGTGLGLVIAREAIARHGGRIDAASVLGVGSRFVVELPLAGWFSVKAQHARKETPREVTGGSLVRLVPRRT